VEGVQYEVHTLAGDEPPNEEEQDLIGLPRQRRMGGRGHLPLVGGQVDAAVEAPDLRCAQPERLPNLGRCRVTAGKDEVGRPDDGCMEAMHETSREPGGPQGRGSVMVEEQALRSG
jgi:hypothetical protein